MQCKKAWLPLLSSALALGSANVCAQQGDFPTPKPVRPSELIPPPPKDLTERSAPPWAKTVEILSDTRGVDFDPYIRTAVIRIRNNWYNYIPAEARPPQLESGETVIEFAVMHDGKLAGMKIVQPAEYKSMDRGAWGGLIASNPFPPLPKEFKGNYLKLRMHFFYNPPKEDKKGQAAPNPADSKDAPAVPH